MEKCPSPDLVTPSLKVRATVICNIHVVLTNVWCSFDTVSKSKVVIFGGATGDTGKYIITGDTYALDLISSKWSKLEGKNWLHIDVISLVACLLDVLLTPFGCVSGCRFGYRAVTESCGRQLSS